MNAVEIEIGSMVRIGGKLCRVVGRGARGNTLTLDCLPQKVWRPATIEDARQFRDCRVRDMDSQSWMEGQTLISCSLDSSWFAVRDNKSMVVFCWKQCEVEDDQ